MNIGPWLVIRGTIVGVVGLVVFSLIITSSLSVPPVARAEGIPTQIAPEAIPVSEVNDTLIDDQNPTECAVSGEFPQSITQWCILITKYAQKNYFPPDLVAAVILVESNGDSGAYSKSGAVGLMQVMPRDGISARFMCVNGPCFSNRPSIAELNDPEFNVKYGTKLLAGLYNRRGTYRDALKAYGPMDVGYSYADKVLGVYERYRQ